MDDLGAADAVMIGIFITSFIVGARKKRVMEGVCFGLATALIFRMCCGN